MPLRDLIEKPIYRYLVEIGLQPDFIAGLKKGNLLIPADLLCLEVEKAIASEKGVSLKRCEFNPDGIQIEMSIVRYRIRLRVPLKLELFGSVIDGQHQIIEFKFVNQKLTGENLLGKIASAVVSGFITRKLNEKISKIALVTESEFDHKGGRCVIDLSSLKQIQILKKKIPIVRLSVLDVFTIKSVEHVAGGIRLGRNPL
jgi:hypothetical protein